MHCTSHLLPLNIISSLTRIKIPIVKEVIFMVDTIDVEYIFPNKRNYNICFELLNSMAKHKSHQIHKEKWQHRHSYVTNAFKSLGWLKIRFYCYERGYALRVSWKPYFTVYLDHNPISVSSPEDYTDAENNFNLIISNLNNQANMDILPYLNGWNVLRFDYAFNLYTPYVQEYLNLFHAGLIPKGFTTPKPYTTSFYMKSKRCTYNFYDKRAHLKEKYGYTDSTINTLSNTGSTTGILRLEIQCHSKELFYLKDRFSLPDKSVKSFWQLKIAREVLLKKISNIIGDEDIYSYDKSTDILLKKYANLTYKKCEAIIMTMANMHPPSLQIIKSILTQKDARNKFNYLLYKIRESGVNPIPLESCYSGKEITYLPNPCQYIMNYHS